MKPMADEDQTAIDHIEAAEWCFRNSDAVGFSSRVQQGYRRLEKAKELIAEKP